VSGFATEYSIPYLQSKIRAFDLPDLIRGLTPIIELFLTTPAGQNHAPRTPRSSFPASPMQAGDGNSASRRWFRWHERPAKGWGWQRSSTLGSI